ncbi:hypothetical protein B0H16DRAFT_1467498 [Mycena metata]|uniref:Uncharacterized protein n=1 Tax=Mycena metata TaxID=1033252 RepID=A0AAD7MW45_9AGAR|nr:hypothetical protein B0H16DRAFT_1467498 [Mycena metata]
MAQVNDPTLCPDGLPNNIWEDANKVRRSIYLYRLLPPPTVLFKSQEAVRTALGAEHPLSNFSSPLPGYGTKPTVTSQSHEDEPCCVSERVEAPSITVFSGKFGRKCLRESLDAQACIFEGRHLAY